MIWNAGTKVPAFFSFRDEARRGGLLLAAALFLASPAPAEDGLTLERNENWLIIRGPQVFGGEVRVNYLEAYCRPNSAKADWVKETVIGHRSELLRATPDGRELELRDTLSDGVVVQHHITADADSVEFRVTARNPTALRSQAHWAQPCVRLGPFTGHPGPIEGSPIDYLANCFVFLHGKLTRFPFEPWATEARYTPGQVWRAPNVSPEDVNPRPLSPVVPDCGLIGCFSGDGKTIFATAWDPYQELFQGVARCLHSDFRIGGLDSGETKEIRGKIYLVPANPEALLARYRRDFPELQPQVTPSAAP